MKKTKSGKHIWTGRQHKLIKKLWAEGLSGREIADRLEEIDCYVSNTQVVAYVAKPCRRAEFPRRTKEQRVAAMSRGVKNSIAKRGVWGMPEGPRGPMPTVQEDIEKIRPLYDREHGVNEIVQMTGLPIGRVRYIIRQHRELFPHRYNVVGAT